MRFEDVSEQKKSFHACGKLPINRCEFKLTHHVWSSTLSRGQEFIQVGGEWVGQISWRLHYREFGEQIKKRSEIDCYEGRLEDKMGVFMKFQWGKRRLHFIFLIFFWIWKIMKLKKISKNIKNLIFVTFFFVLEKKILRNRRRPNLFSRLPGMEASQKITSVRPSIRFDFSLTPEILFFRRGLRKGRTSAFWGKLKRKNEVWQKIHFLF